MGRNALIFKVFIHKCRAGNNTKKIIDKINLIFYKYWIFEFGIRLFNRFARTRFDRTQIGFFVLKLRVPA
jgi:hypothetical protein